MRIVAPFTGAWIEIQFVPAHGTGAASLPSRERGLKFERIRRGLDRIQVAPFTGAWIEILGRVRDALDVFVAPFTGAWIEIQASSKSSSEDKSRSLHGSVD